MEQFINALLVALLTMSRPSAAALPGIQMEQWPQLKITEHLVPKMPTICGTNDTGCAVVRLEQRTCDIYLSWYEPKKATVRERLIRHCRGDDGSLRSRRAAPPLVFAEEAGKRRNAPHRAVTTAAID